MLQDSYLAYCKRIYALRALDLMGTKHNSDYYEYALKQVEPKDLKVLTKKVALFLKAELAKKYSKHQSGVETKKGRSRRVKPLEEWINEVIFEMIKSVKDPDGFACELINVLEIFPSFFKEYEKFQRNVLTTKKSTFKGSEYKKNLEKFSGVFNINEKEKDIITFLFLTKTDNDVEDYFSSRELDVTKITKHIKYFCRFFDIEPKNIRELLSKESILVKSGIVVKSIRDGEISLSESAVAFLSGMNKNSIEDEYVLKAILTEVIELKDHHVKNEKLETIKNLLSISGGCNIILHGHPGTGKTEFAKSLAKELKKDIFFINQADIDGEESLTFRKQAIIAAHNIIPSANSIIVVDECDKILNIFDGMWKCENKDSDDRKAWINSFLENAQHKIIWISNQTNGIDESTKRRFSYSLEFQPLSFTQRKKVWETQVSKQKIDFLNIDDVLEFAKNMKINSGGITLALRDVQGMKSLDSREQKINILKSILQQHESFTTGKELGILKKTKKYDLSILNADYPLENLLQYAEQFLKDRSSFNSKGVFNLNLLLQGPPGTGKTEFAKHLAEVTDRELTVKRASDIRSKWYGESVQNIAKCFKEAEVNGNILFFDEADTFFGSRENSGEYHAEETNEFLTQMENFQGLLVCATNFTQKLDQASLRRFNYKVKFDYLNVLGKEKLFKKFFSDLLLDEMDVSLLEALNKVSGLTPGDYKVVFQKNIFSEKKLANDFLKELENEVRYKTAFIKKVGLSN